MIGPVRGNVKTVLVAAVLGLLVSPLANAQFSGEFGDRHLKILEDPLAVRFSGDADKTSKAKLAAAIDVAALAREWKVVNQSDGRYELRTLKNGKHVLHVMVTYGDSVCEIRYIDSLDMMYKEIEDKGRHLRVIHGNYNVWIRQLADAIGKRIDQPMIVSAPVPPPAVVAKLGEYQGNGNFYSSPVPTRSGSGYRFNDRAGRGYGGGRGDSERRSPASVNFEHSRVVPEPSGFAAIEDLDKVPVREAGKDRYRTFLAAASPKAFVVGEDGGFSMSVRDPDAMVLALDECMQRKVVCALYAVDDRVVFNADPRKRISQLSQLQRAH